MFRKYLNRFRNYYERETNPPLFADLNNPKLTQNQRHARFKGSYNRRRGLALHVPDQYSGDHSQDALDDMIFQPFHDALTALGFERSQRKLWVCRDLAPICHIFSLEPYGSTGLGRAPAYGISLDFVPHIASGSLKWHRTVKSARYDLRFLTRSRWMGINTIAPEQMIRAEVKFILPRTLKMAKDCWSNATTMTEVEDTFTKYKSYERRRHEYAYATSPNFLGASFDLNSPARAFVAAKQGNTDLAHALYDDWSEKQNRLNEYPFDEGVDEKLRALMADL